MAVNTKETVFVVDDEKIIADTLALILRQNGYNARAFYSGNSAIEAAMSEAPQLLLSDVAMPVMSGVSLAKRFTTSYPNCRILLFSDQENTAHLLTKANRGGYQFELLNKPIHPKELLNILRSSESGIDTAHFQA